MNAVEALFINNTVGSRFPKARFDVHIRFKNGGTASAVSTTPAEAIGMAERHFAAGHSVLLEIKPETK